MTMAATTLFDRESCGNRFTDYPQSTIKEVVKDILYLRENGFTYAEIDQVCKFGRKAKYIMNGTRAKFLLETVLVNN
jgi:hypothetical protein